MINQRWEKRLLRAKKGGSDNLPLKVPLADIDAWEFSSNIIEYNEMKDSEINIAKTFVKGHEKIMLYLQKENHSGHAHNLDMLLDSVNINQHLREAFLSAEVKEDAENNCYNLSFIFGPRIIEFKLSKKGVDNG